MLICLQDNRLQKNWIPACAGMTSHYDTLNYVASDTKTVTTNTPEFKETRPETVVFPHGKTSPETVVIPNSIWDPEAQMTGYKHADKMMDIT